MAALSGAPMAALGRAARSRLFVRSITAALCHAHRFPLEIALPNIGIAAEPAAKIRDARFEFGIDRCPSKFAGASARDYDDLHSRGEHRPQLLPVAFAHAALQPIAH